MSTNMPVLMMLLTCAGCMLSAAASSSSAVNTSDVMEPTVSSLHLEQTQVTVDMKRLLQNVRCFVRLLVTVICVDLSQNKVGFWVSQVKASNSFRHLKNSHYLPFFDTSLILHDVTVFIDCICLDLTVFVISYSAVSAASMSINVQFSSETCRVLKQHF